VAGTPLTSRSPAVTPVTASLKVTSIELSPDDVENVRHGHRVKAAPDAQPGLVRGVSTQGELVALMELVTGETGEPEWQPKKVFFS